MGQAVGGSFRDPHGTVFTRRGILYRQVNTEHREHYERLLASGLYDRLVADRLLVSHEEVDEPGLTNDAYRVLRPELVPFVSYPYEWCFSALKDAALATLDIQKLALDHGMSLRDASAFNIQFVAGRPLLIDTLSFEQYRPDQPWAAYRQFCQHFLAPLALLARRDVRLGDLMRSRIDGVPLDLASALLPWWSRARPGLALHVHAQARAAARAAAGAASPARAARPFSLRAFHGLLESLRSTVDGLRLKGLRSTWSHYYEGDSYSREGFEEKERIVKEWLHRLRPETVWDLGANTGSFSRTATATGADVVSMDADPVAVELNYQLTRRSGETQLLPLVMDLTNPSPALGWGHAERMSLAERGPAAAGLALALVHHLALGANVPLPLVAEYLARLATAWIVEFVPAEDPKAQLLTGGRDDLLRGYGQQAFEDAFAEHFHVQERAAVADSGRVLYLLAAR